MWLLSAFGLFRVGANYLIGRFVLLPFSESPDWFKPWFLISMSFSNDLALPLLFVRSLCAQTEFPTPTYLLDGNQTDEIPMTPLVCNETGELYL